MTEIVTETHVAAVLNDPVKVLDKDEEFDKDSGNHSGEEVEMENGDDVTCEEKVACDLDKEGPHCHIDGKQTKSNPPSRKNSIAEELKAKIASVSRRNSFGSRRSSVTGSRRGSIQSIKEDPTCEEECGGQQPAGEHCHVDVVEDPTCANGDTCSDKQAEPHCHVDNASNGINNRNGDDAEKLNASNKDDPTCVEKKECPDTVQGDHCHVDKVDGQGHANDDDNDVITNVNDKSKDDRKQILQPNSPAGVVTMGLELAGTTAPPATRVSNDSTPQAPAAAATNMKETDSPAGVKEPTGSDSVPVRMPPTEHHSATSNTESVILPRDDVKMNNENTAINKSKPSEKMTASTDNVTTVPATVGATTTPVRARDRTRSKSRPSSPSSESRRSRFSSKERKSSGLEKVNHDLPDVSNVRSKLHDKNPEYKPPQSTKKIEVRKLNWKAESKIENNNLDYKKKALQASKENGIDKVPKKIENHKLEWKVEAKTVTRNSGYVPPSKSEKKIETFKINWNAESKLNTRENINYKNGESVSPTRSATMRRQRSRSSHGTERSMTTSSDSSKDAGGHGGRQTASAAPINRRPPVSTDTNNKSNETN